MMRLWLVSIVISCALCAQEGSQEGKVAAGLPEAPAEVTPQTIDVQLVPPACVPTSLNTVDADSGGNWVIKRAFWEASLSSYDKIVQLNDQLFGIQTTYVNKRNDANRFVDTNFIELGFDRGELSQLLIEVGDEIQRRKDQFQEYTAEDAANVKRLEAQLKKVAGIKDQMEFIDKLDDSLDEVMTQVTKSIGACRTFEKKAWENYKLIGKELNDKRAKDLYYQMESFNQSIMKQIEYLKGELASYFSGNLQKISDAVAGLKTEIADLKSSGTDLKAHYDELFKKQVGQLDEEKRSLEKQLADEQRKEAELEKIAKQKAAPWYQKIGKIFTGITTSIERFFERVIQWIKGLFGK